MGEVLAPAAADRPQLACLDSHSRLYPQSARPVLSLDVWVPPTASLAGQHASTPSAKDHAWPDCDWSSQIWVLAS